LLPNFIISDTMPTPNHMQQMGSGFQQTDQHSHEAQE